MSQLPRPPAPDVMPDSEYDLVIIGSGGGSMCAALAALELGKRPVILEKQDRVGGSTGFSGGVWWIPNNALMKQAGAPDSFEKARRHLEAVVTYRGPATTPARFDAFLKAAPRMLDFLRGKGLKVRRPLDDWPDYYDDRDGGSPQGRSVLPVELDLRRLGPWQDHLSTYGPLTPSVLGSDEWPTLFLMKRTFAGKARAMKFAAKTLRDKVLGRVTVSNGGAIQGRMLLLALQAGVPIFPGAAAKELIVEGDRVVGARGERNGRSFEVRARDAVLVNAGGFSRNIPMRERLGGGRIAGPWTNANPGDTGEMIEAMMRLGAATDCLDTAWWVLTSCGPEGRWPQGAVGPDGGALPFMHVVDLSMPHLMLVDQDGRRYVNESASYMEVGEAMHALQQRTGRAIPSWVIFDRRNRERYPWGPNPPGVTPQAWLDSGYMKNADTIEDLARVCGIDPEGLKAQVARFNGFCETGEDLEFRRGARVYDNSRGDPSHKPNPNLGAIAEGPFYAVAAYPGDVGTAGGVVTDQYGRVLRDDGRVIGGLYAIGNSTASVFGRVYPGAGASIAASFTFGYLAALHSAQSNELTTLLA